VLDERRITTTMVVWPLRGGFWTGLVGDEESAVKQEPQPPHGQSQGSSRPEYLGVEREGGGGSRARGRGDAADARRGGQHDPAGADRLRRPGGGAAIDAVERPEGP
jgi:hypothetical protein